MKSKICLTGHKRRDHVVTRTYIYQALSTNKIQTEMLILIWNVIRECVWKNEINTKQKNLTIDLELNYYIFIVFFLDESVNSLPLE